MTAAVPSNVPASGEAWTRLLPIGLAAAALHALMMIPGYNESDTKEGFDAPAWITMTVVSLLVAFLLFRFVVPGGGAVSALVLSLVAALTIVAYWAILTFPIAAAAIVIALRERQRPESRMLATIALVIAALAVIAVLSIIIGEWTGAIEA